MEKSGSLLPVLFAGLMGAVLVTLFTSGYEMKIADESLPSDAEARVDTATLEALDALREENQEFRGRLMALESKSLGPSRKPLGGGVSKAEFESLEQEVRTNKASSPASPEFEEQVASALSSIRKNERIDKAREGQEKWSAQREERIERVSDWLELDSYQMEQYRTALERRDRWSEELIEMWESGVPDSELGEAKRENTRMHIDEVAVFFTPQQLETYSARIGGGKD
ncbi:MAG TPA: hypothetical protein DDW23_05380 [Planctomycetes bacterium]|nr:hypothetical protein [Planctomycetota bacterium]